MSKISRRMGPALSAVLVGLAAGAAPAHALTGGFNPSTSPPIYPGTSTTVDSWKLIGTQDFAAKNGASLTVVAGRWVIATEHAGLARSHTFRSPEGRTSKVLAYYEPSVPGKFKDDGSPYPAADVSVSLLETAMPAPAAGFPKLVEDMGASSLADSLPGYVLWAGQGGYSHWPVPRAQWALPYGAPAPGATPFKHVPGDSGSTGFYYPSASSGPLVTGVVAWGGSQKPLGRATVGLSDTVFGSPIGETTDGTFATVADWIKAVIARHPEATPPRWTTLAAAGIDRSALRPAAPTSLRVSAASSQAIGLNWNHAAPSGVERTGYRVTVSPTPTTGRATYDYPATQLAFALTTGLQRGTEYTITVQAKNTNGLSVVKPGNTVEYLLRANPSAAGDLRLTSERATSSQGRVDYCARVSWTAATTDPGTVIDRYDVAIGGETIPGTFTAGSNGRFEAVRCGLETAQEVTATVRATSGVNRGPLSTVTTTIIDGAPAGTPFSSLENLVTTARRTIVGGKADYCLKSSWTAPTPPAGFELGQVFVVLRTEDFSEIFGADPALASSARTYEQCGLSPATEYVVTVQQPYVGVAPVGNVSVSADATSAATTLAGVPQGTAIPAAAITSATGVIGSVAGSPALCADVRWDGPTEAAGFPITGYQVVLLGGSPRAAKIGSVLAAGARTARVCGLTVGSYTAYLYTKYAVGSVAPVTTTLNVPS